MMEDGGKHVGSALQDEGNVTARQDGHKGTDDVFRNGVPGYGGLMRYGVMTAENPDPAALPGQENAALLDGLKKTLTGGHLLWEERSAFLNGKSARALFVFNARLDTLRYYALEYRQVSFIYGELKDGNIHSEYWERLDTGRQGHRKRNPYVMKDSRDERHDADGGEDRSVTGKNFVYTIPFSVFRTVGEKIDGNLSGLCESQREGALRLAMEGVGETAWNYRGLLYRGLLK